MTSETITYLANLALTLSFIVALVFGIAQVNSAKRDRKERLTLEVIRQFQTREFTELLHYVNVHDIPKTRAGMQKLPANEQVMLIQYSQQMESLGMLVAEKLIDIGLVDKTLGSFVVTSWEKYKPMAEDLREKQPDPFLNEYFQWLAESIDKRMAEQPREPFFKASSPR